MTNRRQASLLAVLLLLLAHAVRADFGGPIPATRAISPDGNVLVRIKMDESPVIKGVARKNQLSFYEYNLKDDKYVRRSGFELDGRGQLLLVSNEGDIALISLSELEAIRLYSKAGKLRKTWKLDEFLTPAEIKACAQTGATLQWFEEGGFSEGGFYFRGPSHMIRALQAPYTVIRGYDDKVSFSGHIELKTQTLEMDKIDER